LLETLTQGFASARERLAGKRELTEEGIDEALRDVRMSLLEADVDFSVVRSFLARVKEGALGEKVATRARDASGRKHRVTPGQHFVAICERELVELMGPVESELARGPSGVLSVLLLGLQGVGKTTMAAKLARHLSRMKCRPLLVAADPYRPAAVLQLQRLGEQIGVPVHVGAAGEAPAAICAAAAEYARRQGHDAIVYDTAGRLAIDEELMRELEEIAERTSPANTLLVIDALMGRDAVTIAKEFSGRLPLDGLVLTKIDGDARGGAALTAKAVTGVPIKFLSTGESLERLEPFRPEGLATRILGMGDVVGLVRDFEEVVDQEQAEEDAERMLKGQFTLEDFLTQIKAIKRMGPLKEVFAKLPMFGSISDQVDDRELVKVEAMVGSMTRAERTRPEIIDKSRASRIARGSGRRSKEVHDLVKRFGKMREVMSSLGRNPGLLGRVPGMGQLAGAGGVPDPASLLAGPRGDPGGGSTRGGAAKARARQKKKRKQSRKDRKRGRRR
jgi:signal recognition particle subunit SRP54